MINPIRIAILEDHSPTLEGYLSRLKRDKNIKVVATATYGEQLIPMIEGNLIHQLMLDFNVPNSQLDRSPYHTPVAITEITKKHPHIDIIVISMFNQQTLIQHLKKSCAKGFMLKDDLESFDRLGCAKGIR